MILSVTPNTAIDRTLLIPNYFQVGDVSRVTETIVAAGGKGLNVARAIQRLGVEVVCAGFVGGHSGRHLAELAEAEGLSAAWTWIGAETRTCVIIISPDSKDATVFNEPGPTISAQEWAALKADVVREAARADCACLCGSLPSGTPPDAPADLIQAVRGLGVPVWVDTSKTALRVAIEGHPSGIKVNAVEAGNVLGRPVSDRETALEVATTIRQMGPEMVVLTLGRSGAVMVTEEGRWWGGPPDTDSDHKFGPNSRLGVVSTVGSGDTFLAGLVTGLVTGLPPADALRRAVATGTANALQAGGGIFHLSDFEALFEQTKVRSMG